RPLADPIDRQYRCVSEGRRIKCGRCVRSVMGALQDQPVVPQRVANDPRDVELVLKPRRKGSSPELFACPAAAKRAVEHTLEGLCRIVVVDHGVQVAWMDAGFLETIIERTRRKASVVLYATE